MYLPGSITLKLALKLELRLILVRSIDTRLITSGIMVHRQVCSEPKTAFFNQNRGYCSLTLK